MSVRLLFPTFLFEYDLLEEGLVTKKYLRSLKDDMDAARRKDPVGRKVSNQYTGWQSDDGFERRPAWTKLHRIIKDKLNQEVIPFIGCNPMEASMSLGNVWANINDKGAWNSPHKHNGCWYSGAFYVHADGDEGAFVAIDTDDKVVADHPAGFKHRENHVIYPKTGTLLLFPSAMMHMVEPNLTDKDRYSIAFNAVTHRMSMDTVAVQDADWNKFEIVNDHLVK